MRGSCVRISSVSQRLYAQLDFDVGLLVHTELQHRRREHDHAGHHLARLLSHTRFDVAYGAASKDPRPICALAASAL